MMASNTCLPASFYDRDVVLVARELLGMRLVRRLDGQRLAGYIVETEAYRGEDDLACHARAGRTPRTAPLYGPPGLAYVYFTYGLHWCLNCVSSAEGFPAAVLLRAVVPVEGLAVIAERRAKRSPEEWCNGPGKLTQAMAVDGSLNGRCLWDEEGELSIEHGYALGEDQVITGPRVGINRVSEPWRSIPWRFLARPHPWEAL
jgi:DNA-3-methyladenine glycosylase